MSDSGAALVSTLDIRFRGTIPGTPVRDQEAIFRIRHTASEDRVRAFISMLEARLVDGPRPEPLRAGELDRAFSAAELTILAEAEQKDSVALTEKTGLFWSGKAVTALGVTVRHGGTALAPSANAYVEVQAGLKLSGGRIARRWQKGLRGSATEYYLRVDVDSYSSLEGKQIDLFGLGTVEVLEAKAYTDWRVTVAPSAAHATGNPAGRPIGQATPRATVRRRPALLYAGILLLLAVQLSKANGWSIPFMDGYGLAFAIAFGVAAVGAAEASFMWRNASVGWGILLVAFSVLSWNYGLDLPVVGTYHTAMYLGLFLLAFGTVPALMGLPCLLIGGIMLAVALWSAFTVGFAAVPAGNWVVSPVLIGGGRLMMRQQERLKERGWFSRA